MAEDKEAASKTEDATPRKLEEARKKGDVAKTPEVASVLSLAAAWGVIAIGGGWLMSNAVTQLLPFIDHPEAIPVYGGGGQFILRQAMAAGGPTILAVLLAASVAGIFGNVIQHGFLWSPEKLKPDFKKVSPLGGFKRLFGIDGLMQFVKSLLKIAVVGGVAWVVLKPKINELPELSMLDPAAILPLSGQVLKALFIAIIALLAITGAADWLWQRFRFMARMRMSKEELKEEYKTTEGDPHIKAKLRQLRMEKSRRRMMQAVPKATVVVMNPTHYAVALLYEQGQTAAPKCVAKGLDGLALKIRQVAEDAGVPVIEDPPLARALYAAVDIDEMIPHAHYEAVAKIIGFIMGRNPRAGVRRKQAKSEPLRAGAL